MYLFIKKNMTLLFITCLMLLLSPPTFAKVINLYDQPKTDGKIVGTIDSGAGMVPIFTPKNSDWIKVGDPKNGNVGWIQVSELSDKSGNISTQISVTQHTINTNKGPKTFEMVQFGTPQPKTTAETQAMIKDMQLRQQEVQATVQRVMQNIYNNINSLYNSNLDQMRGPIFMPVIVLPPDQKPTPAKPPKS